ncbi:MAG: hypothetical protein RL434_1078 [Pseudomonadota bacterium]
MRKRLLLGVIALGAMFALWRAELVPVSQEGALTHPAKEADSSSPGDGHDDDETRPSRVQTIDGEVVVVLSPQEILMANLGTAKPSRATAAAVEKSYGRIVDVAPYLEATRTALAASRSASAQQAVLAALEQRVARLRGFAADGEITVGRELAELEVQLRRELDEAARRDELRASAESALKARWGSALAAGALTHASWFEALAAGTAQLIEFEAGLEPPTEIPLEQGTTAQDATLMIVVGPAPAVLGVTQRATYYGVAKDPNLRVGMQMTLAVPGKTGPLEGWLVPASALVWHDGAQWFYLETATGTFHRLSAARSLPHPEGRVLGEGLGADSRVVVRGAQALLAEEFRARIPEEDDD